jgi:hypothetical protein
LNPTMLPPQSSTPMNDKTRFNRINGQRRARNNFPILMPPGFTRWSSPLT